MKSNLNSFFQFTSLGERPIKHILPAILIVLFAITFPGFLDPSRFWLGGDYLPTAAVFKNLAFGHFFGNPQMGWPIGMYTPQFPFSDILSLLIARPITIFISDPIRTYIIMVHIALLLNTAAAYWCFRLFRCDRVSSIVGAFLFGGSQYFVSRGAPSLFLAMYPAIPLATMLAAHSLRLITLPIWQVIVCGVIIALSHVYYVAASIALALLAACSCAMTVRPISLRRVLVPVLAITIPFAVHSLALYFEVMAAGFSLPQRTPHEQPIHALRFIDAFIPDNLLTKNFFAYYRNAIRPNSEGVENIGYLATLGVFLSIVRLLRKAVSPSTPPTTQDAAIPFLGFSSLALLVTTLPFGAGLLLNYFFPFLRAQNRFSIFLTCWGILALLISLRDLAPGRRRAIIGILFVVVGITEVGFRFNNLPGQHCPEVCPLDSPDCSQCKANVEASFADVFSALEASKIFHVLQFPVEPYPEDKNQLQYAGFYPYIVSPLNSPFRFSYGLTRDDDLRRELKIAETALLASPRPDILEKLGCAGYEGILIDHRTYGPVALASIEKSLGEIQVPMSSRGFSLYKLGNPGAVDLRAERSVRMRKAVDCFIPTLPIDSAIIYSGASIPLSMMTEGWYDGASMRRTESRLGFLLSGPIPSTVKIELDLQALVGNGFLNRSGAVFNGNGDPIPLAVAHFDPSGARRLVTFRVAPAPDGHVSLRLTIDRLASPRELANSADGTKLGMEVMGLRVAP